VYLGQQQEYAGNYCHDLNRSHRYLPSAFSRPFCFQSQGPVDCLAAKPDFGRCTSAFTSLWCRFVQRHIPHSGGRMVLPSGVREYSTAVVFDLVTRRAINPVDSRWRRVLVSMRCEMLPTCRRSSPWRCGLCLSENRTFGVHLPIKIGAGVFDSCIFICVPVCVFRSHVTPWWPVTR
jgi:hypothetical protein